MPRKNRTYTTADVDTGLLVLALTGHNSVEASRRLKQQGIQINPRTLRSWRTGIHARRSAEIQSQHAPVIEQEMVSTAREIVLRANAATAAAIEAAHNQVKDGDAKDPAAVARNLQTVAGIATDKALLVEGRPTSIVGGQDIEGMVSQMGKLLGFSVDSTAEEITDMEELPPAA